tara:strand:+ start:960 stop:1157 length:198 start_codon:yes stop_codon:yes gene_type:complete
VFRTDFEDFWLAFLNRVQRRRGPSQVTTLTAKQVVSLEDEIQQQNLLVQDVKNRGYIINPFDDFS